MDQSTTLPSHLADRVHIPERGSLEIAHTRIAFRRCGAGDPILLLHGWGSSLESFEPLFQDLCGSHVLIALDFPGHGGSADPPSPWAVQDFAELTIAFMDAMNVQRPHIIGHSFGARIATRLATGWPSRVGRLIFVNGAGIRPPRRFGVRLRIRLVRLAKALAPHFGRVGARALAWLYRRFASPDYLSAGSLRPTFVRVVNEDLSPELPRIQARTLLVWGDRDTETPLSSGETMQRLIPNARLVVLKGAGHFSYLDRYFRFSIEVKRFLSETT